MIIPTIDQAPLFLADSATVESYYKNGNGLFSFHIEEGKEVKTTDAIYQLIGEKNAMSGEALDTATSQKMTGKETMYATALLVPIIILILILSTILLVQVPFLVQLWEHYMVL